MADRGDVTVRKLQQPQWPARPQLPQGQDRAPTRDANPGLSGAVGQNRIQVPAGAQLQSRFRPKGGQWSTWGAVAGDEIEFRMVADPEEKSKV